jgi:hypothetical protein
MINHPGDPQDYCICATQVWPWPRVTILVLIFVFVEVLVLNGFEPKVAVGIALATGWLAADTAARLFVSVRHLRRGRS